eukprot:3504351-Lingulodinium_polyedra.AAC.1
MTFPAATSTWRVPSSAVPAIYDVSWPFCPEVGPRTTGISGATPFTMSSRIAACCQWPIGPRSVAAR